MPSFNVITHISNGAGLQKDAELMRERLTELGHSVRLTQFNDPRPRFSRSDVNIFIEVIVPHWISYAQQNWFVPNSEWYYPVWDRHLPQMRKVLAKTHDCQRIWASKVGERAIYVGWEAPDVFRPEIPREPTFLHLAGKSETKNTAIVAETWRKYSIPYKLTVSAWKPNIKRLCMGIPNVTQVDRFSESEVIDAVNRNQFFLMPSKYEGYGMAIHEALSCGSTVITTDAPPMNGFAGIAKELLIPVAKREQFRAATANYVSAEGARDAVERAATLTAERKQEISREARAGFLAENAAFRQRFAEVVSAL